MADPFGMWPASQGIADRCELHKLRRCTRAARRSFMGVPSGLFRNCPRRASPGMPMETRSPAVRPRRRPVRVTSMSTTILAAVQRGRQALEGGHVV